MTKEEFEEVSKRLDTVEKCIKAGYSFKPTVCPNCGSNNVYDDGPFGGFGMRCSACHNFYGTFTKKELKEWGI